MQEYRKSEKKNEDNALFVKLYKDIIKPVLNTTKGWYENYPLVVKCLQKFTLPLMQRSQ